MTFVMFCCQQHKTESFESFFMPTLTKGYFSLPTTLPSSACINFPQTIVILFTGAEIISNKQVRISTVDYVTCELKSVSNFTHTKRREFNVIVDGSILYSAEQFFSFIFYSLLHLIMNKNREISRCKTLVKFGFIRSARHFVLNNELKLENKQGICLNLSTCLYIYDSDLTGLSYILKKYFTLFIKTTNFNLRNIFGCLTYILVTK